MNRNKGSVLLHERITQRRGFGKSELIIVIACAIVMMAIGLLLLRGLQPDSVWQQSDSVKMRGIHQSMLVFAREFDGIMPLPGLVGRPIPGRGEEQVHLNTTSNLYGLCLQQNYFAPAMLVSDRDPNPNVRVFEDAEFWDSFDPNVPGGPGVPAFQADLARVSHASYAHLFLFGDRVRHHWRETLDASMPVLGNRGPADGVRDVNSYTTDRNGLWTGYVVAGDHSTKLQTSMTPAWLTFGKGDDQKPDNLFALDDGLGGVDVVLTFTRNASQSGAETHHD